MPTFAEFMRQQRQPQPLAQPSGFADFMRQQAQPLGPEPPEEQPSPFQSFWRTFREQPAPATTLALGRGVLGATSGLTGFSRMANEWAADLGIPVVSEKAKEAARALEPIAAQLDRWQFSLTSEKERGSPLERLKKDPLGTIPKTLFEMAPMMAAGAAGLPGAVGIAVSRAGSEYRRLTAAGAAPEKARTAASLVGTTEAVLERIVPSRILKGIDKDLIGRIVSQTGTEAGTEFLQHYPSVIADLATGLRDGSLNRQDFYGALEDALMGGLIGPVAGAMTPHGQPKPRGLGMDAEIRNRLRDRMVVGDAARELGVVDPTQRESAWSTIYSHLVNKTAAIEIDSELEHAVERSRGAPMIARVPFELGVFQTDAHGELVKDLLTNQPVQIARPLEQILRGVDQDHLRTLLAAEQDIELAVQDKPGTQVARSVEDLELLRQRLGQDGFARLQNTASEFRDWLVKTTIDPLIRVGVKTETDKANMLAKGEFYSPMVKVFDEVDDILFTAGGKQFQGVGDPIKKRKTSFGPEGTTKILDPIETAIRRTIQITKYVERQQVANLVRDKFRADPALQPLLEELGGGAFQPKDSFFAYEDGKRSYFRAPEAIMDAINSYTGKQMDFFTEKILSPMARLARAGFTYAPDFALAATVKDQWEAFVFTPGLNPLKSFVPGVSLIEGLVHMNAKTDTFKEYMQSGAGHGGLVAADRKDVQQLMELKLLGTKGQKARHLLNPLASLQELGNTLSEASRLGIFAARKRAGDTTEQARHWARYALTDFRRMGKTGEQLNAAITFFNAQIQGLDKYARTFNPAELVSKDAGKRSYAWQAYTKALASVTMPSILLWLKNKDDEDYQRLPTWEKNSYWHLGKFDLENVKNNKLLKPFLKATGTGEYWFRIPKPFELGWTYGSLPERALDYLKTQDPAQLMESLPQFRDSILPNFIIPTAAQPFVENFTNKQFFFGTPVVPHGTENRPPEEQYTERTPQLLRDISGAVGQLPGAGALPAGADIRSPAKLENISYGLTGTLGRDVVNAADAALYGRQGPQGLPLDPRRMPVFRRFTSPADPNLGAQPIREMFQEINRVDGLATTVSSKVKAGKTAEAEVFAAQHPEYRGAKWIRNRRQKYLDERKVWERIRNSALPPDEKQRLLKEQEAKMVATAEMTMDMWREYLADVKEKK